MSNEKSEQDCRTTEVSKRIIRLFDYMESSGYMPSDMVYVIRRLTELFNALPEAADEFCDKWCYLHSQTWIAIWKSILVPIGKERDSIMVNGDF